MGMCFVFSIEFQKRGAPHVHLVIWLNRPLSIVDYDQITCAELHNPETQPRLYTLVVENHPHRNLAVRACKMTQSLVPKTSLLIMPPTHRTKQRV